MRFLGVEEVVKEILEDRGIREALDRATKRFVEGRERTIGDLGDFADVRKRTREIKDRALDKAFDLWLRILQQLSDRGVDVEEAVDAEAAREIIYRRLCEQGTELLVKGKSITSEEIGLNPFLQAKGIEVIETDLGERIIQIKGEKPSHLIVPAVHRTKEEVARLFSTYFGEEIPPDPYVITKKVREDLRSRFLNADAGFTGINVVSAEPATFFLMTNEGNGRLCATMPPLYITLVGYEKIVESMEDALWILRVLPRNSVGLRFASYVSLFRGPFRWKDRRWVVVLLDNGRKRALGDPYFKHALRCIRCGACMNVCPVYRVVSGLGFSHVYMGGIGVVWTAITEGLDAAYRLSRLCTGCGRCEEVCPVEIPIAALVEEVRARSGSKDILERAAPEVVKSRERIFLATSEAGKLLGLFPSSSPFTARVKKEGEVQLYLGCLVDQLMPSVAEDALYLLEAAGFSVGVDKEECCGLPLKVYGNRADFYRLALKNVKAYSGKRLVFVCDSCLSTFLEYKELFPDADFEVVALAEALLDTSLSFKSRSPLRVAVHIPCHLKVHGKERALFELMDRIVGITLLRDEYEDFCCGGAGIYRYKTPEVSRAMAEKKIEMLERTNPDLLITTCPSCIKQLEDTVRSTGMDVKVLHLATFLRGMLA